MSSSLQVQNRQRKTQVDGRALSRFLQNVASELDCAAAATLVLVGDRRMRELNRLFRGKDRPTDVLSFPMHDAAHPELAVSEAPYLGDIVISVETAGRQARRRGSTLERELRVLALHGYLHLLGYDHERDQGQMRRIEYRLRRKLGVTGRRRRGSGAAPAHGSGRRRRERHR